MLPSTNDAPEQMQADAQKPAKMKKFVPKLADFMPTKGPSKVSERYTVLSRLNDL